MIMKIMLRIFSLLQDFACHWSQKLTVNIQENTVGIHGFISQTVKDFLM